MRKISQSAYKSLYELSKRLHNLSDYRAVLDVILEHSVALLRAERGYLVVERQGELSFLRRWGENGRAGEPVSTAIVQDVLAGHEILSVDDASEHDRYQFRDSVKRSGIRSVVAAPLDRDQGVALFLESPQPGCFAAPEIAILEEILGLAEETLRSCALLLMKEEASLLYSSYDFRGITASDPQTLEILSIVARVAADDSPVLVEGPTGTGKELFVRAIHANSRRADGPFVVINCGAMPRDVIEAELFGHVRGAFTGATTSRDGLFAAASGGTIFLDELGELERDLQVKLLRVLESGEVRPVGATQARHVDIRVVAATNRDLAHEVATGAFREDLYYRVNVLSLKVPPLQDRPGDILPLFYRFVAAEARKRSQALPRVDPEVEQALLAYGWPGNVRELANVVQRMMALHVPRTQISLKQLGPGLSEIAVHRGAVVSPPGGLREMELELIREHLQWANGNKSAAARSLGITREGLRKKMKRLGIR